MPHLSDSQFSRSVVLICSHDSDGAMGFVLNQGVSSPTFQDIYTELDLTDESASLRDSGYEANIYCGGPVEKGRGFVLHSPDLSLSETVSVTSDISFTSTLGALRHLAGSSPPSQAMIMLGYSGWTKGQLEDEIGMNSWLLLPATKDLLFATSSDNKYNYALSLLGIDESSLSSQSGSA